MCGRFSFVAPREKIIDQFNIELDAEVVPNYNTAPSHQAYVITNRYPGKLHKFIWGLIPYWMEYNRPHSKLFNARCEGILSKASFRIPIRKRRCIVLADSFYEWKKIGTSPQPYRILLKSDKLMTFAGVWDVWENPETKVLFPSFSVLTCPPNKEMESIHERMPVILDEESREKWLEDIDLETVQSLMKTPADDILRMYPVSQKLNKPTFNSAELHESVTLPPTLFD